MTLGQFASPGQEIPRDRWGRPLVVPVAGGKPVSYTRATTYVGCLEDTYNLAKWQMRMTALGLVDREDLHLAVAAHRDDKDHLNKICDQAIEAAKAHAAATTGTALHSLTEQHDRGTLDLARVPAAYRKDIEAYASATDGLEVVEIEQFGVIDDLKIGGTWDRCVRGRDGRLRIADVKTGSVEWGMGKIAMQLSVYARCTAYTHADPSPRRAVSNPDAGVDQDTAIVIHLPAGKGKCHLIEVDIAAGWEAVDLARQVRAWRARKDLARPHGSSVALAAMDPILDQIKAAPDIGTLRLLWAQNHASRWTPAHTAAAAERKAYLIKHPDQKESA